MANKVHINKYLEDIRKEFHPLRKNILSHPFVKGFERGIFPLEKLRFFAKQQFHIINGDLRNLALYVALSPEQWIRNFFIDLIQEERIALENLFKFAGALKLSIKELKYSEPHSYCLAFTNYFTRLATYGTLGEIAASILLDFECWGENCNRLSKALKKLYGLSPDETKFLDGFYPIPKEFYETIIKIIGKHSLTSEDRKRIRTAVRLALEYELMFWDSVNNHGDKSLKGE